jgi:hypothetical protein
LIELTNGAGITTAIQLIPTLERAAPGDVWSVDVLGRGVGLHWEGLDFDLSVPALLSSVLAEASQMAELGRVGGRRTSPADPAALRRNGGRGGRPGLRLKATP